MKKSLIAMLALAGALNAAPVAVVNGESIDDAIFGPNPAELNQMPADARKRLIDSAIDRKLVLMEAKKEKVENSKEYKTGYNFWLRGIYGSEAAWDVYDGSLTGDNTSYSRGVRPLIYLR